MRNPHSYEDKQLWCNKLIQLIKPIVLLIKSWH